MAFLPPCLLLGLIECRLHLHSFPRLLYRSTPHSNFIGVFEVKERGAWMQVKSINLVYLFCLRKMLIIRFGIIEPSWMCICMHIHSSFIIRFLLYFDLKKLIRILTIYYWVPSSRKSKQKLQDEKEGDVFFFVWVDIVYECRSLPHYHCYSFFVFVVATTNSFSLSWSP